MTQVKGTALVSTMRFLAERFGDATVAQILARLSAEDRAVLDQELLVSAWYPLPVMLRLMKAAAAELGAQNPDLIKSMGRKSADYGIKTVYRIFIRIGSPQFVVARATRVFASYYDRGTMTAVESRDGHAAVELRDFPDGAPEFCDRILGWMARTIELSGAKDVRSRHSLCVHRGDPVCRYEGDWK
jgi:hypothetical protein